MSEAERYLDFMRRVEAAETQTEREWLLLEFSLAAMSSDLQMMVWAGGLLRWFDSDYLQAVVTDDLSAKADWEALWEALLNQPFVEPFEPLGHSMHERTQKLLRKQLWKNDQVRFQQLSQRAADYCDQQPRTNTVWRIETLYHKLLAREAGAEQLFSNQGIEWHNQFEYEKVSALITPVIEAVEQGWVTGNAAGWAYYRLGRLHQTYSRYRASRAALDKAQQFLRHDQGLEANCIKALGDVHISLAEYNEARTRYEQALPLFREIGARLGEANCITALGDVHRMLDEYNEARTRYEQAIKIYEQIGAQLGYMNALTGLADLDRHAEEWSSAKTKYLEILAFELANGLRMNAAISYRLLGKTARGQGDLTKAESYYKQSIVLFKAIGRQSSVESVEQELQALHNEPEE